MRSVPWHGQAADHDDKFSQAPITMMIKSLAAGWLLAATATATGTAAGNVFGADSRTTQGPSITWGPWGMGSADEPPVWGIICGPSAK